MKVTIGELEAKARQLQNALGVQLTLQPGNWSTGQSYRLLINEGRGKWGSFLRAASKGELLLMMDAAVATLDAQKQIPMGLGLALDGVPLIVAGVCTECDEMHAHTLRLRIETSAGRRVERLCPECQEYLAMAVGFDPLLAKLRDMNAKDLSAEEIERCLSGTVSPTKCTQAAFMYAATGKLTLKMLK